MKSQKAQPKFSVAELFCGCGGFSHGFWRAGRFQTVLGNDVKRFALQTFKLNHSHDGCEPAVIEKDIRTAPDAEIIRLLRSKGVESLDCLLGGPPCQGFSQMRRTDGRRGSKVVRFGGYNKLDQDPRNDLVLRFLEIAAALNPKVIVIENVPQFLSHYHDGKRGGIAQQVEEVLGELGYEASCGIMNAADYGVPQIRQRAVIIASRLGKITLPMPTHGERELLSGRSGRPWVSDGTRGSAVRSLLQAAGQSSRRGRVVVLGTRIGPEEGSSAGSPHSKRSGIRMKSGAGFSCY